MTTAYLLGLGSYLPKRVMTNADFEKIVDTTDEWITSRTGIKERRIAAEDETCSDMAYHAATRAVDDAGLNISDIDFIIVATITPDYPCPSASCILQGRLGAQGVPAMDLNAACSGFPYCLSVAEAFIKAGTCRNVLVVASEKMSSVVDYTDRATCVLFGDGAAAAVVSSQEGGFSLDSTVLGADGENAMIMSVPAGGSAMPACQESIDKRLHYFRMQGKEVFKHAVRRMESVAEECISRVGVAIEQIDWLIPHQANTRIVDAMAKRSTLPTERVYNEVSRYGNTSGSSVAIALNDLIRERGVASGQKILLVAFGGGMTWGATLLTKI
jgi:3-oxoacyl-[acyl-carrier-protein] synthase-3